MAEQKLQINHINHNEINQINQRDPPHFRIIYFAFGGRAAPLRLAAYLGGICYEDRFESFRDHGLAKKEDIRRWVGIPEVTILDKYGNDVVTVGQSNACLRYIGTLTGLYPTDIVKRLLVDEILDSVEDMNNMMSLSMKEKDSEKKKSMRLGLMQKDKLPYMCHKFEKRLEENEKRGFKNGYFVGDQLSIADLKFYFQIKTILNGNLDYIDGHALVEPNPRIVAFAQSIEDLQGFKNFKIEFAKQQKEYKQKKIKTFINKGKILLSTFYK
eukprot:440141_1